MFTGLKITKILFISAAIVVFPNLAYGAEMGTPEEAKALSQKAAEAARADQEKAFADFADPAGGFQDKDLYVFCMDMQGVMLAHAIKPNLVGKKSDQFQ